MALMDELINTLNDMLVAKEQRRRALAALSLPEKVAIIIRLQELAEPLLRARGIHRTRWRPDDAEPVNEV
jgi:hypothetical protein